MSNAEEQAKEKTPEQPKSKLPDKLNIDIKPPVREGYTAKFGKGGWRYHKNATAESIEKHKQSVRDLYSKKKQLIKEVKEIQLSDEVSDHKRGPPKQGDDIATILSEVKSLKTQLKKIKAVTELKSAEEAKPAPIAEPQQNAIAQPV
jgi:hypothetical protein